jgi:hypothetical protein
VSCKDVILILLFLTPIYKKISCFFVKQKVILMNHKWNSATRGSDCYHPTFGQRWPFRRQEWPSEIMDHLIWQRNLWFLQSRRYTGCFKKSFTMVFQMLLCGECLHLNTSKLSIVQHLERWIDNVGSSTSHNRIGNHGLFRRYLKGKCYLVRS